MNLTKVETYISPTNLVPVMYDTGAGKFVVCGSNMQFTEVSYQLSWQADEVIEWARRRMLEEQRIESLAQTNPAIRDAKTALDVLVALAQAG